MEYGLAIHSKRALEIKEEETRQRLWYSIYSCGLTCRQDIKDYEECYQRVKEAEPAAEEQDLEQLLAGCDADMTFVTPFQVLRRQVMDPSPMIDQYYCVCRPSRSQ